MNFHGAVEYYAYRGLDAGYKGLMTEKEMYDYVFSWPLPLLKCRKETEECYTLGFLLGMEIKQDEQEEKEKRRKTKEHVCPIVRIGNSPVGFHRPRTTVE